MKAVAGALSGPSGATAVALVALAVGVLALCWISRSLDADADRAVLGWLHQHGQGRLDQIASGTGLRPATGRLCLVRLARAAAVTVSGGGNTRCTGSRNDASAARRRAVVHKDVPCAPPPFGAYSANSGHGPDRG